MILVMPFRTAWLPFVFSVQKKPEAKKIYSGALTYFLLAAVFLLLILTFFVKEIILLISTAAYLPGVKAIPFIALAYIFFGLYNIVDIGVLIKARTIYYTLIIGIGTVVNILMNIFFMPKYGMMAAAINTALSYLLIFVLMYFFSNRLYKVHYEKVRILKIIGIGIFLYCLGISVAFHSVFLTIMMKVFILFCYPFFLYLLNFFRSTEIAGYKKIVKEAFNRKGR